MKYVRMSFNSMFLCKEGGIPKKVFEQMLSLLPSDYKIIGFREEMTSMMTNVFIGSDSFIEVEDLALPPAITPFFKREIGSDGKENVFCEKIDFGDALAKNTGCVHAWALYQGLTDVFEYCSVCNIKK